VTPSGLFHHRPPIDLALGRDRKRSILRGHPWIFADSLREVPKASAGSLGLLRTKDGKVIAQGIYDPGSHLAFRVCAVNPERLNDELLERRILRALEMRELWCPPATNGYRIFNGEGDLLPGLVCDRFGSVCVFQLDGDGPAGFWNIARIAEIVCRRLKLSAAVLKSRARDGGQKRTEIISGQCNLSEEHPFQERGMEFRVDLVQGQKTGFFLDQRENRHSIRELSKGKRVLNLFGYNGGFSIAAGLGGARGVDTVDSSAGAIASAVRHWTSNGLSGEGHRGICQDAFEFLAEAETTKMFWDLVVVDPPSFAPGKQHVEAAKEAYIKLFGSAGRVVADHGIAAFSSCSSHISPADFLAICEEAVSNAKRRAIVRLVAGQPFDHPFPLACQELQYLKFVLIEFQ
jgi:23S rRNA (cytosine1962-C5)-methyltransferase